MSKDVTFQLDVSAAGALILQNLMVPTIDQAGKAIAARAQAMANSTSTNPPKIEVNTAVGIIKRGRRAIAVVKAVSTNQHQEYIGAMALAKSKDAGHVN